MSQLKSVFLEKMYLVLYTSSSSSSESVHPDDELPEFYGK